MERKNREGTQIIMVIKVFDLFSPEGLVFSDPALQPYINVEPRLLLKGHGRHIGKFGLVKVHLVERLANHLSTPGHLGKKQKIITSWSSGKYNRNMKTVLEALKLVEEKTKQNPLQVLIRAVENASPKDETTTIEYGGARYPQAVDVSPSRRVNLCLRWIVQGAYQKCFGKKTKMVESLAREIVLASEGSMESYSMSKKNDAEKQADAAR